LVLQLDDFNVGKLVIFEVLVPVELK
jgi:hypothetical protein